MYRCVFVRIKRVGPATGRGAGARSAGQRCRKAWPFNELRGEPGKGSLGGAFWAGPGQVRSDQVRPSPARARSAW